MGNAFDKIKEGLDEVHEHAKATALADDVRNRALNNIAAIVTAIYGPRCDRKQGGCHCCVAWTVFDAMEQITDSGHITDLRLEDAIAIVERTSRHEPSASTEE